MLLRLVKIPDLLFFASGEEPKFFACKKILLLSRLMEDTSVVGGISLQSPPEDCSKRANTMASSSGSWNLDSTTIKAKERRSLRCEKNSNKHPERGDFESFHQRGGRLQLSERDSP